MIALVAPGRFDGHGADGHAVGEFDVLGIVVVGDGGGDGRGGEEGEELAAVLKEGAHRGDGVTGGVAIAGWGDETNPGVVDSFCFRASFRARWVRWKSDWIWLE